MTSGSPRRAWRKAGEHKAGGETEAGGHDLSALDQAFLTDGEPFRVLALDDRDAVVEMVWTPGPNPCRTCWERDSKFFG